MKTYIICCVLVLYFSLALVSVRTEEKVEAETQEVKESNETKEFMADFKKVVTALSEGKHADKEKSITGFVTKYGKIRICKFIQPELTKKDEDLSDENKAIKKSCDDEKQGDKEFIQVAKDNFVGSHHMAHLHLSSSS